MADTILFAQNKGQVADIQKGEAAKVSMRTFCRKRLQRTMPTHGMRLILAFADMKSKWHDEQCTLAEFSAYVARDVIAHIELAAEARVKKPQRPREERIARKSPVAPA